jgi:perosamine synthetase
MISTATKFLAFHLPLIEEEEIQAVTEVLRSGWLTTGPKVKQFERDFGKFIGARHAVAVNSGTAALHLALEAIGLGEGDEVIVPTLTFAATAEAVLYFKAKPVLVDSTPDTFNMDPDEVVRAISPRTKAIIPVHFGGHPCEMARLLEIARHHGLKVIEDAAHALPARYRGKTVGTLGDITCFSFYATKTITTGEGGMATTGNDEYAERMRIMSLHGISKDAWKRYSAEGTWRYEILAPGYKYNLTDLQAALGIVQLGKCESMWARRVALANRYTRALASLDAFQVPKLRSDIQHAWHLYVILVNPLALRIHRDQLIEELRNRGIGTSVHFIPLHTHPYYRQQWGYREGDFPVAEKYFDRCISLPLYPAMSADDLNSVSEALTDIAFKFRR